MAFNVEDGTIVAGANAYIEVTFADDYFTDRGEDGWTGANDVKQEAIVKATDYIENRWGHRFKGRIKDEDQELSFPRVDIFDREGRKLDDTIPTALKRATAEYALRALTASLQPDPTIDASGRQVQSVREKVGPIETETEYVGGGALVITHPYPKADQMLRGLVHAAGVIRA